MPRRALTTARSPPSKRLAPFLKLALKSAALARMAGTLAETYLGRDPGRRVHERPHRCAASPRRSALCCGTATCTATPIFPTAAPPEQIIPLLNDYADVVVSAVHGHGGDVLKLIGDGTLAIFAGEDREPACLAALAAAARVRKGCRRAQPTPCRPRVCRPAEIYLALHVGEVFYGNVGSKDRLDFTVIGPAVNEVSRILAMSRSVEQDVLLSAAFAARSMRRRGADLVSVGRYALRGVAQPQELFTLEPGFDAAELLL